MADGLLIMYKFHYVNFYMPLFAAHFESFPLITGGTTKIREFVLTFLCLSTARKTEPEQS